MGAQRTGGGFAQRMVFASLLIAQGVRYDVTIDEPCLSHAM